MDKIRDKIVYVIELVLGILIFVMIMANFLQMVTRYFINMTVTWVEDFSVLGLYWCFALGTPMAWLLGQHMEMNILENILPKKLKKVLAYITQVVGLIVGVLFVRAGLRSISLNKGYVMSIIGFDEMWRYIPVVVCGILLIAAVIFQTVEMIQKDCIRNKRGEN